MLWHHNSLHLCSYAVYRKILSTDPIIIFSYIIRERFYENNKILLIIYSYINSLSKIVWCVGLSHKTLDNVETNIQMKFNFGKFLIFIRMENFHIFYYIFWFESDVKLLICKHIFFGGQSRVERIRWRHHL